jgi:hypothetical protein
MITAAVVLSKTFNNRFDFERGLWWRKTGQGACAPQMRVLEHPSDDRTADAVRVLSQLSQFVVLYVVGVLLFMTGIFHDGFKS